MRVVITGANRGLGLEFTRQYLARGESVVAAARAPEGSEGLRELSRAHPHALVVLPCDVTREASVKAFAAALGDAPVDVLVNNAGVMGKLQGLEALDLEDVARTFSVNAVGPLRVVRALLPAVRRGAGKKLVHVSSGMGSLGDNTSGGAYGYRMSKAALNMASRSLSVDLRPEGIISVVFNPGWVKTDMGGPQAPTSAEDSIGRMIARIDALTLEDSGRFLDYRGHEYAW